MTNNLNLLPNCKGLDRLPRILKDLTKRNRDCRSDVKLVAEVFGSLRNWIDGHVFPNQAVEDRSLGLWDETGAIRRGLVNAGCFTCCCFFSPASTGGAAVNGPCCSCRCSGKALLYPSTVCSVFLCSSSRASKIPVNASPDDTTFIEESA